MEAREGENKSAGSGLTILICIQVVILPIVGVAPFGWDRPSSWGLDVGHVFLLGSLFVALAMIGLLWAMVELKWNWILGQVGLLVTSPGALAFIFWARRLCDT